MAGRSSPGLKLRTCRPSDGEECGCGHDTSIEVDADCGGLRRSPGPAEPRCAQAREIWIGHPVVDKIYAEQMAGCKSRAEFERVLRAPKGNEKLIRATLGDRELEEWALPALGDVLGGASADEFGTLKVIARPCVSKKRVTAVCGPAKDHPWRGFFGRGPAFDATGKPAEAGRSRRSTSAAKKATGQAIPLRDAGRLLSDSTVRRAAMAAQQPQNPTGGKAKKKPTFDPFLETSVTCRECLRTYKRVELPNPRRRVCENCGGQPESKSIRTVSGGSPGLGRRR